MVSSSFKANADIVSDAIELIPRHPILDNYVAALAGTPVVTAILNSLIMAGGETSWWWRPASSRPIRSRGCAFAAATRCSCWSSAR
jgi:ABC-type sugar transport system, permease component